MKFLQLLKSCLSCKSTAELGSGSYGYELSKSKLDVGSFSNKAMVAAINPDGVTENDFDLATISDVVKENNLNFSLLNAFFQTSTQVIPEEFFQNVRFLERFLEDPGQQLVGDDLLKSVDSMFREAVSIFSEYDFNDVTPKGAIELRTRLLRSDGIFEQSSWLVFRVRCFYDKEKQNSKPKPSREYYPITAPLGFVDHLVENLDHLVKQNPNSIGLLKPNILELRQKLHDMSCVLVEVPPQRKEDGDFKALIQSFASLAYEVEYAIDSYLVGDADPPIWYCKLWLDELFEEIKIAGSKIEIASGNTESIIMDITRDHLPEPYVVPILRNSQEVDIVCSGSKISDKVREFFWHPTLESDFGIRTWCLVSSYKERRKEVFRQLLENAVTRDSELLKVTNQREYRFHMSEDELRAKLYGLLYFVSSVVILEDVRDVEALVDIVSALPKYHGCRVLVFTHSIEVATKCRNFHKSDILNERAGGGTSEVNKPTFDNDMVGFAMETERMLESLTRESYQLCIISIVGMAGQGKSTLAMKLYNDALVVDHFDARMWCYVSQVYEKRGLLLELLSQVIPLSKTVLQNNDEELAEMLYKYLKGDFLFSWMTCGRLMLGTI